MTTASRVAMGISLITVLSGGLAVYKHMNSGMVGYPNPPSIWSRSFAATVDISISVPTLPYPLSGRGTLYYARNYMTYGMNARMDQVINTVQIN